MAAWLLQALRLLAAGTGGGIGFEVGRGLLGTGGVGGPPALLGSEGRGGIPFFGGFGADGEPIKKRRRRRRALTASDKADIAFIVGLLGPAAGKQFSTTLAARPR